VVFCWRAGPFERWSKQQFGMVSIIFAMPLPLQTARHSKPNQAA